MVSVIINYCSNEKCFLDAILTESSKFSKDIVISYGSHLYDGTPEDIIHINEYQQKYPQVQFVSYKVDKSLDLTKQKGVTRRPTAYWHNMARWTATCALKNNGWVFVLDADEIPEGDLVKEWLNVNLSLLIEDECYKCANYWYFKDPTNRAQTLEDSVLLIHSKHLTENNIFGDFERDYLIAASRCTLKRQYNLNNCGLVLYHHFSWCRSKNGLEHKIANWAHSNDIFKGVDVKKIVEFIFKDDNVNDIVHHYKYTKVENRFNIKM